MGTGPEAFLYPWNKWAFFLSLHSATTVFPGLLVPTGRLQVSSASRNRLSAFPVLQVTGVLWLLFSLGASGYGHFSCWGTLAVFCFSFSLSIFLPSNSFRCVWFANGFSGDVLSPCGSWGWASCGSSLFSGSFSVPLYSLFPVCFARYFRLFIFVASWVSLWTPFFGIHLFLVIGLQSQLKRSYFPTILSVSHWESVDIFCCVFSRRTSSPSAAVWRFYSVP